ncbi:hypothetical protein AB1Y20_022527 [Prymnesium parvum]|uniref:Calx-beta domain-containing protein n=1 Tax=Prymnesium parvum TaxID=97485 RepID=A0AB34JHG7_PRYPA
MSLAIPPPASPSPLAPPGFPGGCDCSRDNQGLFVFPLFEECDWPKAASIIWYSFLMIYFFYAVSIVSNIFMEAIEVITSKERSIKNSRTGETQVINVWNPTVANLTLMALGSSAPEILLALIEVMVDNFESGELGPGTIVGSAAFNLFMIVAICVMAIPTGQVRRIEQYSVFITTATCSVFAYLWLYIVLRITSPNLIEIWEAVLTFLFFPLLVGFAYVVDKGMMINLGKRRISPTHDGAGGVPGISGWVTRGLVKPEKLSVNDAVALVKALRSHNDVDIPDEEIIGLVQALKPKSRSEERKQAMKLRKDSTGVKQEAIARARISIFKPEILEERPAEPSANMAQQDDDPMPVCFESKFYRVSERDGSVVLRTVLQGAFDKPVVVAYTTRDGQGPNAAKAGQDYTHAEGILIFAPGERRKEITIPIINDDEPEPDEDFEVALATPKATAAAGNDPKKAVFNWGRDQLCKVLIIDDDRPGVLRWNDEETVFEKGYEVTLTLFRYDGNRGDVSFRVVTEPTQVNGAEPAVAHKDYMPMDETITMRNTVSDMIISIPITTKTAAQHEKAFRVKLLPATGETAGKIDTQFSEAIVRLRGNTTNDAEEEEYARKMAEMINATLIETDQPRTYADQFHGAFYPETDVKPNVFDWLFHFLVFPWKILFATIPPPSRGGGWPCFLAALFYIGLVTFFIQEIATIFGCVFGMAKACNAVIFVAVGTSLPDALASKSAALNDLTADASVGNVTGSNCVNVFLGLGLPWLLCSIYWSMVGPTAEWVRKYPQQAKDYPNGGFVVPGEDLGFAVITFIACAAVCFVTLGLRRAYCGGELGGPKVSKVATAVLFSALWLAFIILYCTIGGEVVI